MSHPARSDESGFTLVEMLVVVALFALIGMAGFAVVDGIVGVQRRTEGRLERLADLQRAMHIITADLEQAEPLSLRFDGTMLSLQRSAGGQGEPTTIAFMLREGILYRMIGTGGGQGQRLVPDARSVSWSALYPGTGWQALLPGPADPKRYPRAVALELTLADGEAADQMVRRVVALPRPVHR